MRNIHLLDENLERTLCGNAPTFDLSRDKNQRWFHIEDKRKCRCPVAECKACLMVISTW